MRRFVLLVSVPAVLIPCTAFAAGELPEIDSLTLWLLGLFVTLMVFRVQAMLARKKRTTDSWSFPKQERPREKPESH